MSKSLNLIHFPHGRPEWATQRVRSPKSVTTFSLLWELNWRGERRESPESPVGPTPRSKRSGAVPVPFPAPFRRRRHLSLSLSISSLSHFSDFQLSHCQPVSSSIHFSLLSLSFMEMIPLLFFLLFLHREATAQMPGKLDLDFASFFPLFVCVGENHFLIPT